MSWDRLDELGTRRARRVGAGWRDAADILVVGGRVRGEGSRGRRVVSAIRVDRRY